jgi:hypothetical protein
MGYPSKVIVTDRNVWTLIEIQVGNYFIKNYHIDLRTDWDKAMEKFGEEVEDNK